MELTTIEQLIIAYAPLVSTLIGIFMAFGELIKCMKSLKKDKDSTNAQIKMLIQQNAELKREIANYLTEVTRIKKE